MQRNLHRGLSGVSAILLAGAAAVGCDRESVAPAADPPPPTSAVPPEDGDGREEGHAPPVRADGTIYGEAELMGTRVSINVFLGDADAAAAGIAMQAALEEMARIESIMSEWRSDSEISALNAAAGGPPREVSPELFEVLTVSREISEKTQGTFDVTFHGVGQLWSFRPGSQPPDKAVIEEHLPLIGWERIELDPAARTARLTGAGMKIGLGAIAKGYAVDRASGVLERRGFPNHVVEAGGDTYASGTKGGKPWMVGVQDPTGPGAVGALPTQDGAVVTSGDYQRFFEYEGKQYSHILDPKTGWPIESENTARSVTLLAPDATRADAYCTAVTIMGVTAGMAFVEANEELEAVMLTRDGGMFVSSGLAETFVRRDPRGE